MNCPHCNRQLPNGLTTCFSCGKPLYETQESPQQAPYAEPAQVQPMYAQPVQAQPTYAEPAQVQPTYAQPAPTQPTYAQPQREQPASGVKRFTPAPLENPKMHQAVGGTGYIGLIALVAWLLALISPIYSLTRVIKGLWALIPHLLDGSVDIVSGSFLAKLDLGSGNFSGALSTWKVANEIFGAIGGLLTFILGMLIIALVIIPMAFLVVALRKNIRAAQGFLTVNLILCAIGNGLCYSTIKRISDAIGVLQPPYHNIPLVTLMMGGIAAILWILCALIFIPMTAKSDRFHEYS